MPAAEVPPQSGDPFFPRVLLVVLGRHRPRAGRSRGTCRKGRSRCVGSWSSTSVPVGGVKLELCWSQPEISQSCTGLERQQKDHTHPSVIRTWNYCSPVGDFSVVVRGWGVFLFFAPVASWRRFCPCSCFACWSRGVSVSEGLREALRSFMGAEQG